MRSERPICPRASTSSRSRSTSAAQRAELGARVARRAASRSASMAASACRLAASWASSCAVTASGVPVRWAGSCDGFELRAAQGPFEDVALLAQAEGGDQQTPVGPAWPGGER